MKWKRERGRLASGDSCFGARPKVPMESHEGDGEADEVRFFGKQEQMSCRKKEGLRERSLSNYPKNVGEIGAEGGGLEDSWQKLKLSPPHVFCSP